MSNTKPWEELGITQKMYEASLQAEKQLAQQALEKKQATIIPPVNQLQASVTNPKPWLEIGITEQDYKTMMSASTTLRPANPDNDFNINDF